MSLKVTKQGPLPRYPLLTGISRKCLISKVGLSCLPLRTAIEFEMKSQRRQRDRLVRLAKPIDLQASHHESPSVPQSQLGRTPLVASRTTTQELAGLELPSSAENTV